MIMSDVSPTIIGSGISKIYESGFLSKTRTSALVNVDIAIHPGETYALVGESGSGKSTLGRILLMLIPPSEGSVTYHGEKITGRNDKGFSLIRRKLQIIPQHPEDALNPRWKLSRSVLEPYEIHPDLNGNTPRNEIIRDLLKQTGLNVEYVNRYPHQLSGGELQRAVIARTIALNPDFIVCDEPTSMLDVSVQASIIHLLQEIQQKTRVALLFITHDIKLARVIGDRIGVMFRGQIVEEGTEILLHPLHPYTRFLSGTGRNTLIFDSLSPEGCPFRKICPAADQVCLTEPSLVVSDRRSVRCHNPQNLH